MLIRINKTSILPVMNLGKIGLPGQSLAFRRIIILASEPAGTTVNNIFAWVNLLPVYLNAIPCIIVLDLRSEEATEVPDKHDSAHTTLV